jgi:O-antigen/teichoic acid export membrane protein
LSLIKKLAGETALYGLSSIVGRLLNFFLTPLYSYTLSPAENGVIFEMYSYSAFLMVLYSYRMESAFFRFGTPAEDRERAYSTGLVSLLATTALLTAGILLFAQPIAGSLRYAAHPEYIRYIALILAMDCLSELPFARLRLEQRPGRFVKGKLVGIGVNIVLNLFWLLFCPWAAAQGWSWVHWVWSAETGVGYVFLANLFSSMATLLYLWPQMIPALRRGTSTIPKFNTDAIVVEPAPAVAPRRFDPVLWTQMMAYAAPLILVHFAGSINVMFDRAMLKWLLPGSPEENLAQVGIYGNSFKLAMLITIFTQAYRYAAEPFFFRNAQEKNAVLVQASVTKWFTLIAALGMLSVLLFLDLVQYFLGPEFRSGLHIVPILLVSNVLIGVYYNFSVWYRLRDKTMLGAWISIGGAVITVGMNFLLVPLLGYQGAAWAALACNAFMCWATWQTGRRYYPVPYPLGRMAWYILSALLLYGVDQALEPLLAGEPIIAWVIRLLLFGSYLAMVFFLEKKELPALAGR